MNRLLTLGVAALMAVVLAFPAVAVARRAITMDTGSKIVVFDHAMHVDTTCESCHATTPWHFPTLQIDMSMSCQTCHHLIEGEQAPAYACSSCHFDAGHQVHGQASLYDMAHERNPQPSDRVSCLSCHYEVAKLQPERRVELTACSGSACHP